MYYPVDKYLFKVSKITLEQRPSGRCSNAILLTLNRHLSTGYDVQNSMRRHIPSLEKRELFVYFLFKCKFKAFH